MSSEHKVVELLIHYYNRFYTCMSSIPCTQLIGLSLFLVKTVICNLTFVRDNLNVMYAS